MSDHQNLRNWEQAFRPDNASTSPFTCADVDDLVAPFVLGALEADESERIERHCRDCASCDQLVAEHRRTVGLLPFLVPATTPAPDVKAALFARIDQTSQQQPSAPHSARVDWNPLLSPTPTLPASGSAAQAAPRPVSRPRFFRPGQGRSSGGSRRFGSILPASPLVTVPLVLALVLVGTWAVSLQSSVADRSQEIAALENQLDSMGGLIAAQDGSVYQLTAGSGDVTKTAVGRFMIDPDSARGMVLVQDLETEANDPCQVWVVKDDEEVRLGSMTVDQNGRAMKEFSLDTPIDEIQGLQIVCAAGSGQDGSASARNNVLSIRLQPTREPSGTELTQPVGDHQPLQYTQNLDLAP